MKILVAIVAVIVIGALAGNSDSDSGDTLNADACNKLHSFATDAGDGVLSDSELRDRAKEIDDAADYADAPLPDDGRQLLAAVTTGSAYDVIVAIGDMSRDCRNLGL